MLEPLERFFRRVGCLVLLDRAADPAANGHVQRNGADIKAYSGGAVRSLSDLHASSHTHASHTSIGTDDHHAQSHTHASHTGIAAGDHHAPGADISARVRNSVAISIANNVWTALTFDTEDYDTDTIHSTVSNTGRLTVTTAGKYLIIGQVQWAQSTAGDRGIEIRLNGVVTPIARGHVSSEKGATNGLTSQELSTQYNLAATDYLELFVYQDSGAALNVTSDGTRAPMFMMMKVLG